MAILFVDGFDYLTVGNTGLKWDVASVNLVTGIFGLGKGVSGAVALSKLLPLRVCLLNLSLTPKMRVVESRPSFNHLVHRGCYLARTSSRSRSGLALAGVALDEHIQAA
jgi:hypothetical protein